MRRGNSGMQQFPAQVSLATGESRRKIIVHSQLSSLLCSPSLKKNLVLKRSGTPRVHYLRITMDTKEFLARGCGDGMGSVEQRMPSEGYPLLWSRRTQKGKNSFIKSTCTLHEGTSP